MIYRTIIIEDIGEYSIFIRTEVPKWTNYISISEKGVLGAWHMSKEVVKTENGIIAYFDEKIDSVFKKGNAYSISFFRTLYFTDIYGNAMTVKVKENLM